MHRFRNVRNRLPDVHAPTHLLRRRLVHLVHDAGYVAKADDPRGDEAATTIYQEEPAASGRDEQRLQHTGAADRFDQRVERELRSAGVEVAIDLADGDLANSRRGGQFVHVVGVVPHAKAGRQPFPAPPDRRRGLLDCHGLDLVDLVYRLVANAVVVFFIKGGGGIGQQILRVAGRLGHARSSTSKGLFGKSALIVTQMSSAAGKTFPRSRVGSEVRPAVVKLEVACCVLASARRAAFRVGR